MKLFFEDGGVRSELKEMNGIQNYQATRAMERVASYIPIEGKDYDIELTFNGHDTDRFGIKVVAHNKNGEFWRDYVNRRLREDNEAMARMQEEQHAKDVH